MKRSTAHQVTLATLAILIITTAKLTAATNEAAAGSFGIIERSGQLLRIDLNGDRVRQNNGPNSDLGVVAHPATPDEVVAADVAAQNTGNWGAYLGFRSDMPGAPESVSSYTALWAQSDTGIRDNVMSAEIDDMQPIPIELAKRVIDTCCYTAENLRAFYVIINYTVRAQNSFVTNGPNARMYVLAETPAGWKIVQVSEPLIAPILEAGYAIGTTSERSLFDRQRARLQSIPQDSVMTESSRIHTETTQPYPSTIKVGHFSAYPDCRLQSVLGSMDFTLYIRNVLPNEWWPSANFNTEALKAGALAVKGVGWYRMAVKKYPTLGVDVSDNTCDQVYKAGSATSSSDSAFCDISGVAFQKADGQLFYPAYVAGPSSASGAHGGTMYQNGTQYLAAHLGYAYSGAYRDIARYYYDNSSSTNGQAIQFFTYNDTGTACTATTQPPTAPTGLSALAVSSSAITVSWNGSANTTAFLIYRWTGSWTQIASVAGSARSFTDNGLPPSSTFYYTLCAQNTAGTSCAATSTSAMTTAAIFGILAPTGLWPGNNVSVRGAPVHLSWSNVGALWYNVAVMRWTGSSWVSVSTFYAITTRYDFSASQPAWYAWRAQGVGLSGGGPWSDWAYFYFTP